ncbi:biotin-dependent carboxyltransferase family protein (plasmid) [Paracoccus sp. TD-10]|uniref:5-oxoprolinase subunit C family protein n=1 Tax=Paracoccus sp. TD-10 TaxID=3395918 RepID=UPI003AAD6D42
MIEIVSPGVMASLQDLGRPGWRNLGVGSSGAMDAFALRIGNMMVGNPQDLAGIEFTLGGFRLRFRCDTVFALTGADARATLDGVPVPAWWVRPARAGQVLSAQMAGRGMRSYLTVAGGIDVASVMGSRATDLKGGFGGLEGRALQPGDLLPVAVAEPPRIGPCGFGLDATRLDLLPAPEPEIRFIPAKEWDIHGPTLQERFLTSAWALQPDSNRMGYRLSGPEMRREKPLELLSHGILPGTIQLPPGGQPVIQLNDANTCGGYPKLGVVIEPDLTALAQVRLGAQLRFRAVSRDEALKARAVRETFIERLATRIALARDYSMRSGWNG